MKKNSSIFILIALVIGIFLGISFFKNNEKLTMNKDEIQTFINETLVQGDQKGEVKEIKEFGNIFELTLDFSGQESKLYTDKTGKVFFQKIYDDVDKAKEKAKIAEQIKKELVIKEGDRVLGISDAEISIYEYSDFECPFCKRMYQTSNKIIADNKDKVNLVYRHFNNLHAPLGKKEAVAAECAGELGGDKAFFAYHDELYKRTESNGRSLVKEKGRGLDLKELPKIANQLKLEAKAFKACLDEDRYIDKIDADIAGGSSIGVNGTPNMFIINNKTGEYEFIGGLVPVETIQAAINKVSSK